MNCLVVIKILMMNAPRPSVGSVCSIGSSRVFVMHVMIGREDKWRGIEVGLLKILVWHSAVDIYDVNRV